MPSDGPLLLGGTDRLAVTVLAAALARDDRPVRELAPDVDVAHAVTAAAPRAVVLTAQGGEGAALVTAARRGGGDVRVPVVLCCGGATGGDDHVRAGMAAGADAVLTTPLHPADVALVLDDLATP